MITDTRPASTKQTALILRLADEKTVPVAGRTQAEAFAIRIIECVQAGKFVGIREASAAIDYLFALPRTATTPATPTAPAKQDAEPGYYAHDGQFYVVVANKAGTGRYAKRLDMTGGQPSWEYAPGVQRTLDGSSVLTAEQAAAHGHLHGWCVRCLKTLSDVRSAAAGYGATCAKRQGWDYPSKAEALEIVKGWDAERRTRFAHVL